ncbi:protein of Asp/Glu/hydantoin racemase family [Pseudohyphozyma bogoriensis]|nr:protein of Asp/Glu/hydantoin racemase family [Pseudohyphozyma bogoriensis]
MIHLLIINPNSTPSITTGLEEALSPIAPQGVKLSYYTAPSHAPPSINDYTTACLTAVHCFEDLEKKGALKEDSEYDGFLVCCFSDHPLQHMIREHLGPLTTKPVAGIFEAAITHALIMHKKFGILSTGFGAKPLLTKGVSSFMGANGSERWVGCVTTGLGVVELREGDQVKVEKCMKEGAAKLAAMGADCILMGCAGMAGMEPLVQAGVRDAGLGEVRVMDGGKAGVECLVGLVRLHGRKK